jgi:hypothetical protein
MGIARGPPVLLQALLNEVKAGLVDDRLVLAGYYFFADPHLAGVEDVSEQVVDVTAAKGIAAVELAVLRRPLLVAPS